MARKTDAQLLTQKEEIKTEVNPKANSATRVGQMIEDMIESKPNYDDLELAERTATEIKYDREATYGTPASPITDAITDTNDDALAGVIQKIYHEAASFEAPGDWVELGNSMGYSTSGLNIIYVEYVNVSRKEYIVLQEG